MSFSYSMWLLLVSLPPSGQGTRRRLSNVVVAMAQPRGPIEDAPPPGPWIPSAAPIPWRLRGLTFLSLTQCNGVSDAVVSLIVGGMPGITVLDYYDAPHGDPHGKFRM